jgi:uncharacterized protein (DUF1330 family)
MWPRRSIDRLRKDEVEGVAHLRRQTSSLKASSLAASRLQTGPPDAIIRRKAQTCELGGRNRMPAYVIVMREGPLSNKAEYDEYLRLGQREGPPASMKPLAVYGATHDLEGSPPDGMVILEFPDVQEAKAWYNSANYQAAVPHRLASGAWRAWIVEGV